MLQKSQRNPSIENTPYIWLLRAIHVTWLRCGCNENIENSNNQCKWKNTHNAQSTEWRNKSALKRLWYCKRGQRQRKWWKTIWSRSTFISYSDRFIFGVGFFDWNPPSLYAKRGDYVRISNTSAQNIQKTSQSKNSMMANENDLLHTLMQKNKSTSTQPHTYIQIN